MIWLNYYHLCYFHRIVEARSALVDQVEDKNLQLDIVVEAPDTALIQEPGRSGVGIVALGEKTARGWAKDEKLHKIVHVPFVQNYVLGLPKKFLKDPLADIIVKEFGKK